MSNNPATLPCPIEQLVAHSAEHFSPTFEPGSKNNPTSPVIGDFWWDSAARCWRAHVHGENVRLGDDLLESSETFGQLAARRAGNLDLMLRFLDTLANRAQDDEARDRVYRAIYHLHNARRHLQAAAGR